MGYEDPDYRRGRSGRPISRIRAQLKRDGSHICWLCGGGIDMTLTQSNGRGRDWTLDHVLPLDDYPHLWDEPSNHREAHRTCNSARKKKPPGGNKPRGSRKW